MVEDGLSDVGRWGKGKLLEAIKVLAEGLEAVGELGGLLDVVLEPCLDGFKLGCEMKGGSAEGGRVEGGFFEAYGAMRKSAELLLNAEEIGPVQYIRLKGRATGVRPD